MCDSGTGRTGISGSRIARSRGEQVGFFSTISIPETATQISHSCKVSGRAFVEAWLPIAEEKRRETWTEAEREIQLTRRGRYAEFNLIYDRGTRFGLESGHDVDAVLMSMPPVARWR